MLHDEISPYLDIIEKVVGTRWLHDQVHLIRGADPRYEIGAAPGSRGIHPLASSWFNAREELILSQITGTLSFSEKTLRVARLGKVLSYTAGLAGFSAQKNRLLDQSLYRNASYEIAIAAGYVRSGNQVEFTAPGLLISLPGGPVIVDCFVANSAGDADSLPFEAFEKEFNQGNGTNCPVVAYFELTANLYPQLREHFVQHVEIFKNLLTGKAYNALVVTCPVMATGLDGIKLREEGFTITNPAPRFTLPAGFEIYSPGESSSIS